MSKKVKMYIGFRYEAEGIMEVDSDWKKNLEKLNTDAQEEIKKELDLMCLDNNDTCESVLSDWIMSIEEIDDDTE